MVPLIARLVRLETFQLFHSFFSASRGVRTRNGEVRHRMSRHDSASKMSEAALCDCVDVCKQVSARISESDVVRVRVCVHE